MLVMAVMLATTVMGVMAAMVVMGVIQVPVVMLMVRQGHYLSMTVIGQRSDGKWIVRQGDGADADIWIIDGDYEIGDEVDPEDMENAIRGTANKIPLDGYGT